IRCPDEADEPGDRRRFPAPARRSSCPEGAEPARRRVPCPTSGRSGASPPRCPDRTAVVDSPGTRSPRVESGRGGCRTGIRSGGRSSSRHRHRANTRGPDRLSPRAFPVFLPSPSWPSQPSRVSKPSDGASVRVRPPRIPRRPSFPRDPPSTSHPLLRFTGDEREVGRLLEFHESASSRIAESDEAFRRARYRPVQQHVRIPEIPVVEEAAVRRDLFRFVADLQDSLVVLGPLMIAELAALRHGRAHIPGLEVPERADVSPMFRVLVTQEPRAPARVVALPSLPFRDRGDVHHGSFATEFGDGNFLPKEATRVLDAVFNRSATDAIFHEVRLLLRDAGDERRLRVCDHPNLVDVGRVDLRPGLFRIVLFRSLEDAPKLFVPFRRAYS